MSKSFHELLASDPSLSPAFRAAFADDGPVECDWCGCTTHEPVFRNGLRFTPSCLPAYEADQAEAIDLEDTERRLSRAFRGRNPHEAQTGSDEPIPGHPIPGWELEE